LAHPNSDRHKHIDKIFTGIASTILHTFEFDFKAGKKGPRAMELRTLGSAGLVVSRMGLGMAALGRPGYINLEHAHDLACNYDQAAMERKAHEVLDAAWEAGIRYFDAARSYGLGEKFLGSWLTVRAVLPESVTVGSKWGYTYTADWKIQAQAHEIKEHSLATLQRQRRETMALLNGYLDLYQIHSATTESGVLENREVLRELVRHRSHRQGSAGQWAPDRPE
jgi:aryl-alcohol dehydrogenase-like predicted oxidoreductase